MFPCDEKNGEKGCLARVGESLSEKYRPKIFSKLKVIKTTTVLLFSSWII